MSEDLLIGYVREALERIERGEEVDVRALCADHPELADAVAETLGLRQGIGELHEVSQSRDPFDGRVLDDRYELVECLGRGAMGVVYRATDRELQRTVAVKLFHTGPGRRKEDEERFTREALMLASVDDEHVVGVFDRGTTDTGEMYVVMECLSGIPLSVVLEACDEACAGSRPEFGAWLDDLFATRPQAPYLPTVVRWIAEVARGLGAAHEAGVFHRDVKPSNIFIRDDSTAVLIDFGIATRSGDAALTATNTGIGTPWYMAPEQVEGGGRDVPTTDVYGLCATLYHLLTLEPPFGGMAAQVFAAIQNSDPRPIRSLRPDLPRDLVAIVEHGMDRHAKRRYPRIHDLEADLRAFLEHRPVSVRPLGSFAKWTRRVQRRPARAIAVALALLVVPLVVTLTWFGMTERERAQQEQFAHAIARLPYDLAVEMLPAERLTLPAELRERNLGKLDAILAIDDTDFAHRVYRAALLLDTGDHERAASDARTTYRRHPSEYLDAVAAAYENADREVRGHEALVLTDLPAPETVHDKFTAGFLALRGREPDYSSRAVAWLRDAGKELLCARDLNLLAIAADGEVRRDPTTWEKLFQASRAAESDWGRPTARTLYSMALSMIARHEYRQAIALLNDADALCPDQWGVANNLAQSYRKLNRFADAAPRYEQAIALRPNFWRSHYHLALIRIELEDFERARASALAMPTASRSAGWRREYVLGMVAQLEALSEHIEESARAAIAETAVAHFDRAIASAPERNRTQLEYNRNISAAGAEGRWTDAAVQMMELASERIDELDNPTDIRNLALAIGRSELEHREALMRYLRALADVLGAVDSDG